MKASAIHWIHARTQRNALTVLYIGNPASRAASQLADLLGSCGQLSLTIHARSKLISAHTPYDIYVLDANTLRDVPATIDYIYRKQAQARVLVIQDNHQWQITREAFRAGAIDVIRTPKSIYAMSVALKQVLLQQLPVGEVAGV
ncbi:MAG: hypothetical protein AAFN11_18650 [Chloroflexota bacterium]